MSGRLRCLSQFVGETSLEVIVLHSLLSLVLLVVRFGFECFRLHLLGALISRLHLGFVLAVMSLSVFGGLLRLLRQLVLQLFELLSEGCHQVGLW